MAKKYAFRLSLQKAEFSGGFMSVCYGGPTTRYADEDFTGTLAEAQDELRKLSGRESRDHYGSIAMLHRGDRRPPGFKDEAKTSIRFNSARAA